MCFVYGPFKVHVQYLGVAHLGNGLGSVCCFIIWGTAPRIVWPSWIAIVVAIQHPHIHVGVDGALKKMPIKKCITIAVKMIIVLINIYIRLVFGLCSYLINCIWNRTGFSLVCTLINTDNEAKKWINKGSGSDTVIFWRHLNCHLNHKKRSRFTFYHNIS